MSGKGRIDPLANLFAATLFDPATYAIGTASGEGVNTKLSFTVEPAFEIISSNFNDALIVMIPGSLGGGAEITFRLQDDDGSGGVDIPGAVNVMSEAIGNHSQVNVGRVNLQSRENLITAEIDVAVAQAEFACAIIPYNGQVIPVLQIFGARFNV